MNYEIEIARYLTKVEGESEQVRVFGLIPDGYNGNTADLPMDDEIFYWLESKEWMTLGIGETYGGAEIIACVNCECGGNLYPMDTEDHECKCGQTYCGECDAEYSKEGEKLSGGVM